MRVLLAATLLAFPLPALAQEAEDEGGFFSGLFGGDDAQAQDDEGFLTAFIEERLSATARAVDIQGFAGALSSRATIDLLTVADGEGVWLRAEDLSLQWSRSALLSGRIEVDELTAASIEVLRAPIPDPELPQPEATRFRLPELPVSVDIGELRSDRIVLGADILGQELVLSLAGAVNLEGGEGTANLQAEIVEGSEGRLDFAGGYSNETRVLSVTLDLEEAEGGLAARALGIPEAPAIALRVEGTAPIDDYEATLELATDGEERIAGTFALQTTADPDAGQVVERAFGLDVRGDVTPLLAADAGRFLGTDVVLRTKGIRRSDGSLVLTSLGIRGEAIALNGEAEITPEGWPARIALRGDIGVEAGTPVPLPLVADTTVRGVTLDVTYDRVESETWTGTFEVVDLSRPGLTIRDLLLKGGGALLPATETQTGAFTADLDYAAEGLAFTDAGLGAALGADLQGTIDLVRTEDGGPLRIRELTLAGPGIEAQAEGTVAGPDEGFLTQSSIQLQAQDLARFAALTGLDLRGGADVTVVSSVRPLDRIFDLVLSGTTRDLELGIESLDPLLAGTGELRLAADRDETGLRVSTLSLETPAVTATGTADLSSGASRADFDLAIADLGLSFPAIPGPGTVQGSFRREETGEGTLDATATLPGATLSLDADIGADVPVPGGREGPGLVTFEAQAAFEELANYQDLLATFVPDLPVAPAGAADLRLQGTTELDFDLFDVTVEARTRDLALGQPAFDAAFAGEGTHRGRIIRTGFDALRIEDLRVDTPVLDGTLSADLGEGTGSADLDLRLADAGLVLGGVEGPGAVTGTATRAEDGSTVLDLDLSLPTGTARVDGTLSPPSDGPTTFTGDLAADFDDIAPLGTLLGRDLTGAVEGTATGTARLDLASLDLAFDVATQDLALGIPRLDPLLAGEGTFAGRIARDGADLSLDAVRIDTDLLDGTVTAALEDGAASADVDLTLADVAPVLGGLSGPGTLTGTARQTEDGTTALDLDLALPTGTAQVDGTLGTPLQGFPFTGDILADFEDIAPLGTLLGRDLRGALRADLSGTIRPDLSLLDVTFDATSRDLALGIPQLDRILAGEGTFAGSVSREGGDLRAEDVRIATDLVQGTVSAGFENGVGSADVDLTLPDVAPVLGGLAGEGRITGTARQTGEGTTDLDLRVALPTGEATVDGTLAGPTAGYAFTGDLRADFTDIAPLGTLLERDLAGAVDATATGTVRPDLSSLDLAFEATTDDLQTGIAPLDTLLQGEGTVSGRATRTGPATFGLADVAVRTDLLSGTVTAAFENGEGTADLDVTLSDVAPVLGGLSGPGRVTGTASGTGDGLVDLDLQATLPTGTAAVDGTLDLARGNLFAGDVSADFDDISPLGPLVGRDLAGGVSGGATGTIRPDLSAFDLTFDVATQDLRLGQPLLDPLLAGPGTFAGRAARTQGGDLTLDLDADTPQLRGALEGSLGQGTGQGRFDLALTDLGLIAPGLSGPATARGEAARNADGSIAVDAQATGPGLSAVVDATIAPPAQGSEITGTADVALADLSLLSPFVGRPLSGGFDGTITGSALPSLARFDLAVDGTTQSLAIGNAQIDTLLAGTGAVSARLSKAEGGPVTVQALSADLPNLDVTASGDANAVTFTASLTDAALLAPAFPGAVSATGTLSFAEGTPTVTADITGPGGLATRISGPVGAATNLGLTGTGPLALFNRILDPRRLEGPADFDLRLTGPGLEFLEGTVTTAGASLADPTLGEAIRNIRGTATLGGGTATLDLTGDLALGGTLSVSGPLGIVAPFQTDLAIVGTGLVIRDPTLYEAVGDARLSVTGPLAGGAVIAGVVDLRSVEGRVPASGVGALGDVPDVFHIEPSLPVVETLRRAGLSPTGEEISPETGATRDAGAGYGLDILLRAPARVFIRGRGLDAELGGELRLTGTTQNVIPIGQFSLLRGRLDLLGQRFELTEGSATIQGDFNPFIRVVAETEARTGTRVAVVVEGPLASPEVSFESTPALPEDEVLAQLLFGVDIASITPLQAVRLASAVATLAGEGTGLLDDLRGGLGLADFDVTTTEGGSIALRLGQYISENVYTDVVVSPESTEATINLDLTPDLTVRAGVSTQGETTLGIFFERDY